MKFCTASKVFLWPWLLLGASLHITGLLFSSLRWQILLRAQDIHQPIRKLFAYYMVGHFFNMFLPTKVGGDVVRIYDTSKDHGSTAQPLAVILVERVSGMLTMLLLAALVTALKINIGFDIYSKVPGLTAGLILFFAAIAAIPLPISTPRREVHIYPSGQNPGSKQTAQLRHENLPGVQSLRWKTKNTWRKLWQSAFYFR